MDLGKWFQSYKYFPQSKQFLHQSLQINQGYIDTAKHALFQIRTSILDDNQVSQKSNDIIFIGVHIRREEYHTKDNYEPGFRAAPKTYITKALDYYRNKYPNAHFTVVSDDKEWCKSNFKYSDFHVVSLGDQYLDLALLSMCEHTIMTTGTYGFWAAWLAEGDVVYYDSPIDTNSPLGLNFNLKNFFPQHWKSLGA